MIARLFSNSHGDGRMSVGLVLLFLLVYLLPLDLRPLSLPDETRYAEIPYEMLISGDWVTPRLNGLRYFEKPPLGYWLNAVSIALLGQSNFAVRLVTALAVGGTALLLYFFSLRFFRNRQSAALAALIYLTCLGVYLIGTHAVLDSLLTLLLSAGIMSYAAAAMEDQPGRARLYWLACGISLGCAFLVKGFLAFAVPVIVLLPWLLWQRQWRALFIRGWGVVLVATIIVLPWALLIHRREADFWHYFFWIEHIKRFSADNAQHQEPFYYFLMYLPLLTFPWLSLLPAALTGYFKSINPANQALNRLLWLWLVLPFVFFSSSSGKLATYILPCLPPLAILLANGLYRYFQDSRSQRLFKWGVAFNLLVMSTLLVAMAYFQLTDESRAVYRTDETPQLVILLLSIALAVVAGGFSLRRRDWRIRLALQSMLLLPALALSTVSLPAKVTEAKSPGQFLLEIAPLIDADTQIVSDGSMFRSLNWYLGRQDVYLLKMNEVGYGLGYPDSAHRLLSASMLERRIQQKPRPPIALFCHYHCPEGIPGLIPADALRRSFGSFSLFLIK
jgi:4-amino-4-deoxy-L-arabinose transferase